jgi:hypothetical protein
MQSPSPLVEIFAPKRSVTGDWIVEAGVHLGPGKLIVTVSGDNIALAQAIAKFQALCAHRLSQRAALLMPHLVSLTPFRRDLRAS